MFNSECEFVNTVKYGKWDVIGLSEMIGVGVGVIMNRRSETKLLTSQSQDYVVRYVGVGERRNGGVLRT